MKKFKASLFLTTEAKDGHSQEVIVDNPLEWRVEKLNFHMKTELRDIGFKGATLRAVKCLELAEIKTIEDAMGYGKTNLKKFRYVGVTSIKEIEVKLASLGLKLPD